MARDSRGVVAWRHGSGIKGTVGQAGLRLRFTSPAASLAPDASCCDDALGLVLLLFERCDICQVGLSVDFVEVEHAYGGEIEQRENRSVD